MTISYPMRREILRSSSAGVRNAQLEALLEKQQETIDDLLKTKQKLRKAVVSLDGALEMKDRRILKLESLLEEHQRNHH